MKDKVLRIIKDYKYYILLSICLAIFIFVLINVLNGNVVKFDDSIYTILNFIKSNYITFAFRFVTRFADEEFLILSAIMCLILIKNRKIGASIAVNLAASGLVNHILKEIVKRPRPPMEFRLVEESSYSFPSGHAMTSLTFYGLIIYFILKNVKSKKVSTFLAIILSILIFLIGISRIYLGVHYASDVLAGFMIGIVYLIIYIKFVLKLFKIK